MERLIKLIMLVEEFLMNYPPLVLQDIIHYQYINKNFPNNLEITAETDW